MTYRSVVTIREKTTMKNIYQFAAWIGSEIDGINDEKFMAAAWILYAWMRREVIDCIPLPEFPATVSGSTKKGRSVAVIYQPEEHFFTLRSSVFESGIRDTVEAEIKPYRHSLLLAVRETVFLREPGSKAKPVPRSPVFVRQLIDEVGLNDGLRLSTEPQHISTHKVSKLIGLLCAEDRRLPVVLISQAKNPALGQNGYLVDGWKLAAALVDSAHVMVIDWDATYELSRIVEDEWSCFGGAVRIYWPSSIDFEADDPYKHPLYTAQTIKRNFYPGEFEKELEKAIHLQSVAQVVDWNRFGVRFYIEAEQTRMLSASMEESTEELLAQCREQLRRVYESKEEYKALAEAYYADMSACREDSQALQKQMTAMAEMMDCQRREIARLKHGKTERPPVDLTYEQIAKWVEQYYPDRLYLHPRAVRALKSAVYQNPSMVYRCLILLAEDYYDYRKGRINRDAFLQRCSAVDPGLSECGFGEGSDILEQGDEYYITYGGKRRLLERHLKKGVSHNALYCLRIYFFWDDKTSHVVIGSLPGHLRSSLT